MTPLAALRRWWAAVVVTAIVAGLFGSIALSSRPDYYVATSIVILEPSGSTVAEADRAVARQLLLADSSEVAIAAAAIVGERDIDELRRSVDVAQVRETDAIRFEARTSTGARAKRVADAWAQAWRDERVRRQQEGARSTAIALEEQLTAIRAEAASARPGSPARAVLDAQVEALAEPQREALATSVMPEAADVVVLPADVPTSPSNPSPVRWGLVAAALAAAVSALAVVLAGSRDTPRAEPAPRQALEAVSSAGAPGQETRSPDLPRAPVSPPPSHRRVVGRERRSQDSSVADLSAGIGGGRGT